MRGPVSDMHEQSSFSNLSANSPTSQLILQHFRLFTYVTAHSGTLPLLHLRHSLFSNPYVSSPTSQLILEPFRCFTYDTAHSPTILSLLLRHMLFTYVTWQATINNATQLPTTLPTRFPSRGFSTVHSFRCSKKLQLNLI